MAGIISGHTEVVEILSEMGLNLYFSIHQGKKECIERDSHTDIRDWRREEKAVYTFAMSSW